MTHLAILKQRDFNLSGKVREILAIADLGVVADFFDTMPIRYLGPYNGRPQKGFCPQTPGGLAGGHFPKNGSFGGFSDFQIFLFKIAIARLIFDLGPCAVCHFVEQFKPEKLKKKISGFTEFSGPEFSKVCFGHFGPKGV